MQLNLTFQCNSKTYRILTKIYNEIFNGENFPKYFFAITYQVYYNA